MALSEKQILTFSGLEKHIPAPYSALLEAAGKSPARRRRALKQVRFNDSFAVYDGQKRLIYIAMFKRWRRDRVELAALIQPLAARHMLPCLRDLKKVVQDMKESNILVYVTINRFNKAGQRMAVLLGFVPGRFKNKQIWLYKERQ